MRQGDTILQAGGEAGFAVETSYETRELAWELAQPRVDEARIRFLLEMGAVPVDAMQLANLTARDVDRHPQLRHMNLVTAPAVAR